MSLALPIAPLLPEAVAGLRTRRALVVEAPTGAGKTTALPPALMDAFPGEVVVLEPRRLAARLAARRVAEERGEAPGESVGWQVRFEDVGGPRTRLRYVTEAILLRRLLAAPDLPGVGTVVLDEFHERHLHGDLALALIAGLQRRRDDLRLVVMSATLDAAPIVAYLGDAAHLRSEGRSYEVAVEHAAAESDRPLAVEVAAAVRRLAQEGPPGDVLVFLPGAAEIERARASCGPVAERFGLDVVTLHGDLDPAEQDRAVRPGPRPKVILSTNVAESSVTVPGVVAVVDGGLARLAGHSPWSGLPTLRLGKVSQASAVQRAGRAGRVRPGRCLRLYTRHDFETRPRADVPEVRRADLAEAALLLHGLGARDLRAFPWFEAPEPAALAAAETLLGRLGAVAGGALTPLGRRLSDLPLHPRLGRLLVEAEARGVADDGAAACALLGERAIDVPPGATGDSDVVVRLAAARRDPQVERARKQLARLVRRGAARPAADPDAALRLALLAAFPDRVGKRRRAGEGEVVLSGGGSAELARESVVRDAPLLVAVEVEERRTGTSRRTLVRTASAIEADWLLDLCPDALREEREAVWSPTGARVEIVARLCYDALVLDETRRPPGPADAAVAAPVLARAALARGAASFAPAEALERTVARLRFVARVAPESGVVAPEPDAVLAELCAGLSTFSFAELERADLLAALRAHLTPAQQRLCAELAPERVTLRGGRAPLVEYGDPPSIASRLQDFFGMTRTPTVGGGRVPLVLHLLAPNGRDVQVTSDLAGFWTRHYPTIRKELMRRYPRHKWPEDPLA
jgi:ATP-dependent helicase HrpB